MYSEPGYRSIRNNLARQDIDASVSGEEEQYEKSLLIVNCRPLERECLTQALVRHRLNLKVLSLGSVEEWRASKEEHPPLGAILFHVGGKKITDTEEANKIVKLSAEFGKTPIVVLSDSDELSQVLKALECGAKGYILTSVGIGVCAEALELAVAGGTYIPASCLLAVKHLVESGASETRELSDMFTPRQADVVNALRKGKANKIIAYELQLRESTVKVHIRNIMKKLRATNRTEIVYKINDMCLPDHHMAGPARAEIHG